jgi:hypothetical protein
MLGIRPSTFCRWYERYRTGGPEAPEGRPSKPDRVWSRIPDDVRQRIVAMALEVAGRWRRIQPPGQFRTKIAPLSTEANATQAA